MERSSFEDTERVRRVVRAAGAGKSSAARIIRGAINDCYERHARVLLEASDEKARELGVTPEEQERQVVLRLQLGALEATLAHARRGAR